MAEIRIAGLNTGVPQDVSITLQGETQSASVIAYKQPQPVAVIPRISGSQLAGNTVSVDTGALTGPFGYQWRSTTAGDLGTAASQVLPDPGVAETYVTCDVTHADGTLTTPPILVYALMPTASHNAADAAALALCPHDDATHVAIADGPWSATSTWLGDDVPAAGARVLVPQGINVTYDQNKARLRLDWVRVDGRLVADTARTTRMLFETLLITRSGALIDGTFQNPVQAGRVHEWIVSARDYRSSNGFEDTDIDLTRDPTLVSRGIINQGERMMWGQTCDTWVRTAIGGAPMAGDTSLVLASVPVGWNVGDTIVIGGTAPISGSESEERVITSISGALVSWAEPLVYNHDHQNPLVARDDLQPAVMNLTRNIVIRSEREDVEPWRRGHTMDRHMYAVPDIWFVEHRNLGRTRKGDGASFTVGQIDSNGDFEFPANDNSGLVTEPLTAQSNIKARYPIHAHSTGFNRAVTPVYHGCSVRDVIGWGMVHHDGHVNMNSCGVYEFDGSGIVSETGNELGEWLDCITIKSRIKRGDTPKEASLGGDTQGDFGRLGYGFMMRSRALRFNRCMSMDCSWGAVFFHRTRAQATVAGLINHVVENLDLKDLQGPYRVTGVSVPDYPIIHASDNEFAGSYGGGLFVSKDGVEQNHGWNVNLKRMKSWAFRDRGFMVEYIGQYALTEFDAVCAGTSFSGLRRGIEIGSQTFQVSIVSPTTERCTQGIYIDGGSVVALPAFNTTDDPRYMIAGHTSNGDSDAVLDNSAAKGNAEYLRMWATLPAAVEPSVSMPFVIADWSGAGGFNQGISNSIASGAGGTLTDTVSLAGPIPKLFDGLGLPANDPFSGNSAQYLRAYALKYGYWMYDAAPHLIFPIYLSDRLYARPVKSIHAIRMTGSTSGYANNGTYTVSANPPVSGDFSSISAPAGQTTVVDVVGASSDPDGGTITLSPSYSGPDHGRLVINGDSAEYTPDPGYIGTDLAWVWIEDGAGHATRCDLTFNVT